jgi:hypothetical protein
MQDVLKTSRTYANRENAEKRLREVFEEHFLSQDIDRMRYLIAVNSEGRYAAVVIYDPSIFGQLDLVHFGITIVG